MRRHLSTRLYDDITCWENKKRVAALYRYRKCVVEYLNNVTTTIDATIKNAMVDNLPAREVRMQINLIVNEVKTYVIGAKIGTEVIRTAPASAGGRTFRFDLFDDFFGNLDSYGIPYDLVIDMLEKAIGVYTGDESKAFWRTVSPLWWMKRLFEEIGRIPFRLLTTFGLDMERSENSLLGRMFRGLFSWIAAFASLLVIANLLGFLEEIKQVLGL